MSNCPTKLFFINREDSPPKSTKAPRGDETALFIRLYYTTSVKSKTEPASQNNMLKNN